MEIIDFLATRSKIAFENGLKAVGLKCLTESQRGNAELLSSRHGFGLRVAVVLDPEKADPILCGGGVSSVGWPGAWGSWWQADPGDNSVLIFLAHNMVELNQFAQGVGFGVFDAILRFQSLASSLRAGESQ